MTNPVTDSIRECKLIYNTAVKNESAMILLRSKLAAVSTRLGFPDPKRENIALVASEIVSNQIKYAEGKGMIQIWQQPGPALDIFALDFGPGIPDLRAAEADGFSTANTLGKGLGSIHRLSDQACLYSRQEASGPVRRWSGTAVLARFLPGARNRDEAQASNTPFNIGLYSRALSDDRFCGDRVYLHRDGTKLRWLHLDGLGHGEEAEKSTANLAALLPRCSGPAALLGAVDKELRHTRGAVAIAGEADAGSRSLEIIGVGDMHAHFFEQEQCHSFSFAPGVLGKEHKSTASSRLKFDQHGLIITASDGIRRNWDTSNFPGLFHGHPQLIAYLLGNIMARISDDQSLCVVRQNQ
ncbi:MAG: hypothetical protein C3F18_06775 [Nitrosomonadales bacterium]|nr:MAG: hypothetical protein C3F18_06775 [Nitrosomonadales bacterium]